MAFSQQTTLHCAYPVVAVDDLWATHLSGRVPSIVVGDVNGTEPAFPQQLVCHRHIALGNFNCIKFALPPLAPGLQQASRR